MKLNIAYPATGCQKLIEVDDEHKLRPFFEKRMSSEVTADHLGDEWKGYVLRISGGNDKQGFPMKQGVLTANRVRLLLKAGHSCYRPKRRGEKRRKSVRGCVVDANLSVLSLVIVRKGEQELPGLTDKTIPRRLGPKRAGKIRKLFNLTKEDDVRQYVVRRPLPAKEGKKPRTKAPKIQRLVTPVVLQRRRHRVALKKRRQLKKRDDAAEYAKMLALRVKEATERKEERRRSASTSKSRSDSTSIAPPAVSKAKGAAKTAPKTGAKPSTKTAAKPTSTTAKTAPKAAAKTTAKSAASKTSAKGGKPGSKPTGKPSKSK